MTGPGWSVPARDAERARRALASRGLLRPGVGWLHEGDRVIIPLRAAPTPPLDLGELVEREFPSPAVEAVHSYRELLADLPEEKRAQLPRSFDVVGDVVLLRLPPELEAESARIGEALLRFVPGARIVGADEGVHGPDRRRSLRRLAGSGDWSTVHRENGLRLDVDLEAAYFSPRLAREHRLVADAVRPGDRVLDLCCGIGPFSLLIAEGGRARSVTAVDRNPAAIELLRRNLARLRSPCPLTPVVSEASEFLDRPGQFDRAVLNHPTGGAPLLPALGARVAPGGILHYYELIERTDTEARAKAVAVALGDGWSPRELRPVHPYSARLDLVGLTLSRGPG
jgi:tRNA (guanine37-N1)-methyltransferase